MRIRLRVLADNNKQNDDDDDDDDEVGNILHTTVCMWMGIPIPIGVPWDSHGNSSSFWLLMGMGIAYFIGEK